MSFDSNGSPEMANIGTKECKPDYEAQAASLKIKLDSTNNLKDALIDFSNRNSTYNFKNISSFAEMVGGVELTKLEQVARYNELLKRVEESS